MKLSNMKARKDVRCIIVEDEVKHIGVYYDNIENMLEIIKKQNQDNNITVIKIFNPDMDGRAKIMQMIIDNLKVEETNINVTIPNEEFIVQLLNLLSDVDIDLDLTNENDRAVIKEIIVDPSDLMRAINAEINHITDSIFYDFIKNIEQEANVPDNVKKLVASLESFNDSTKEIKALSKANKQPKPSTKKKNVKKTDKQEIKEIKENVVNIEV